MNLDVDQQANYMRLCSALWAVPFTKRALIDAHLQALVDHLKSDVRVESVTKPKLNASPYTQISSAYFPGVKAGDHSSRVAALYGRDRYNVLELHSPLVFRLRVLKQHQPQHLNYDDVRSEVYDCAWDGLTLAVGWREGGGDGKGASVSAGQIALVVLREALTHLGDELVIQPCSLGCTYGFLHTTIALSMVEAEEMGEQEPTYDESERIMTVPVPPRMPMAKMVPYIHSVTAHEAGAFARAKSSMRRIRDLESFARQDLMHLLAHYAAYSESRTGVKPRHFRLRLESLFWRREAHHLLAKVWFALSAIEVVVGQWQRHRLFFTSPTSKLFLYDMDEDMRFIELLDLSGITKGAEQMSARLDTRLVAVATAMGVVGGGLTGALVSVMF